MFRSVRLSAIASVGFLVCLLYFQVSAQAQNPFDLGRSKAEAARAEALAQAKAAKLAATQEKLVALQTKNEKLQKQLEQAKNPESVIVVYALKYANVDSVANVVRETVSNKEVRIAVGPRRNRLIIRAPQRTHDEIEKLLQAIDSPVSSDSKRAGMEVRDYHVSNDIQSRFEEILRPGAKVVAINRTSIGTTLKINATSGAHEAMARRLADLKKKMKAGGNRLLRVIWLISGPESAKDIPPDVEPVIAELEKLGARNMTIAARTVIRTSASAPFESTSSASAEALNGTCSFTVSGMFTDAKRLKISLVSSRIDDAGAARSRLAQIDTTITVPSEHPVVLGVNPVGQHTSAFLVMVSD